MKTIILSNIFRDQNMRIAILAYLAVFIGILLLLSIGLFGCKGQTTSPTSPSPIEPLLTPTPGPLTPGREPTPTQSKSCDNYSESPDDPNIVTLDVDEAPYLVTMDCTGDIDWYKIRITDPSKKLNISLADIPTKSDFDILAYDSQLNLLEDGRSARSGNVAEELSLGPEGTLMYLQIYSYSGRGVATLTITTELPDETPSEVEHLSYEEVLSTYYPFYPRGTNSGLLEHSVETVVTEQITCQTLDSQWSGELTIGNYAHVKRELLESTDYVDGWALAVFNGSVALLDTLKVTIRMTIVAPDLDLEVEIPPKMEIAENGYLVSKTGNQVYYTSQSYGDSLGNSKADIRIYSGVVGDLWELFSNDIFTQQVEIEWTLTHSDGTVCSGQETGKRIVDFEAAKRFFFINHQSTGARANPLSSRATLSPQ